ncbi:MAG: erythromycin esterase family protein [Anaerolineales bacterium]
METREKDVGPLVDAVRRLVQPFELKADLDPIMEQIGDARYVLLGEASHGTAEYYVWRARLSQRLIREKGFSFVSVEGDWPDCYQVNRYVKGYPDVGKRAYDVLHAFERWPTWMWANWEIVAFTEWLRLFNEKQGRQVGFYGLDVYSLWESMEAIIDYLEEVDPEAAAAARRAYLCFEPYGEDAQSYAWSTAMVPESCEDEVINLLIEMRQRMPLFDGDTEAAFSADQNALVTVNAEHYYRTMVRGGADSWNVRDRHMVETLHRLMNFHGPEAKGIVWAHNTHVGDARATDMAGSGMVNVGQLVREADGGAGVVLIGFGSHHGSVVAGESWGAPMQRMRVPEGQPGSWEDVLHRAGAERGFLLLGDPRWGKELQRTRGHRAIGVVYHPAQEWGNYVPTVLPDRYDTFIYIDETEALHPLHIRGATDKPPETYPWGV